jgi:predicted XRE-type DNA-binding protein
MKSKPGHITKGNILDDLGLSSRKSNEEKRKYELHKSILKFINENNISPREIEKLIDQPQPRVSELLSGKIANMTIDKLLKYCDCLGCNVKIVVLESRPVYNQRKTRKTVILPPSKPETHHSTYVMKKSSNVQLRKKIRSKK